jgi:flavin-binding protein dodecin
MSVAKVIEVIASSPKSFDDAVAQGIARATDSLDEVAGAWIKDQQVAVKGGKVTEYRVTLKVTFVLKPA